MKERLDIRLVKEGLAESREKAKTLIKNGQVYVDGVKQQKAGLNVEETAAVEVRGETLRYVSRGGLKLEKAMACFPLSLEGKVCMDIGASTGGFTDCMLQNGATKVFAVDVGHDQLSPKLLADERVINLEGTNIRYLTTETLGVQPVFASIDVSFISLTKVLGTVHTLLAADGEVAALIKPQFEAGREHIGKKGVVREEKVHVNVLQQVTSHAIEVGFQVCGLTYSPIKGPEGNIEYLVHLKKWNQSVEQVLDAAEMKALVKQAHQGFKEESYA